MTNQIEIPGNKEIIEKYINHWKSIQSQKMRSSSLNYFFQKFAFSGHVFDINTSILIDYHEFLDKSNEISLQTKKNKWNILTSFLNFTMEYFNAKGYNFIVVIPRKTIKWGVKHKKAKSNKKVIATISELEQILLYFKVHNFKHYLIFRLFIDTGMRKGELLAIKLSDLYINERYINGLGKTGEKIYFFSKELKTFLTLYVNERKELNVNYEELFLTHSFKPYGTRVFNLLLNDCRKSLGITKNITSHTFRRTINTYRKRMDCSLEDRKQLLGHKLKDVNVESYTFLDIQEHRNLYDKFNPYKKANF